VEAAGVTVTVDAEIMHDAGQVTTELVLAVIEVEVVVPCVVDVDVADEIMQKTSR
jgi:hypothetical protein